MKIKNAKVLIGTRFMNIGFEFDEIFTSIGFNSDSDALDLSGKYVIPGLIDIHTHGALGEDASDGNLEGLLKMGQYYAKEGVTSWCPTTMTLPEKELKEAVTAIKNYVRPSNGAKICGINLEGPFVSKEKCGAQNPKYCIAPDVAMFKRLNEACGGLARLITIAAEYPNACEAISEISKECTVSIGHTTSDYDTSLSAYMASATHLTHLFNAMPPLLHREPGVIAAAAESGASAELITDGIHVHPAMVRMAHHIFGKKLCLISDSLRCAGMPDGDYKLGGLDITMKDNKATLTGTDTIAGSSIHLMEGVRRAVSFGLSLEDAVYAASTAPAKAIGVNNTIGAIEIGKAADFVILDSQLHVTDVYIDGKRI